MVSEYFIRERLGKMYDELERIQIEMGEFYLDDPEYRELCTFYEFLLEKIDLLHWVLGDE